MVVLVVLGAALLLARLAGAAGIEFLDSWPAAVRMGLGVMLLFTAGAHFTPMRHDLARMLPPAVPHPMLAIYFTGLCEVAGAVGLQIASTRLDAAVALILFFVAVLPANIHAARAGVELRGRPATPQSMACAYPNSTGGPEPCGSRAAWRQGCVRNAGASCSMASPSRRNDPSGQWADHDATV